MAFHMSDVTLKSGLLTGELVLRRRCCAICVSFCGVSCAYGCCDGDLSARYLDEGTVTHASPSCGSGDGVGVKGVGF